ncbi:MAG: uroporphyrinogen-III synthase, partial [Desulfobacteraceae bacterium]|nr:uroporphyrinogen-III synthase [Desulfobacteraceae bacterium]
YETTLVDHDKKNLVTMLENNDIDIVTFTSSSTVKNFAELIPSDKFEKLINKVTSACIGPITENTARSLGFNPDIVATDFTIAGLMDSILKHFNK